MSFLRTASIAAALLVVPLVGATHSDGTYDQPVWFEWREKIIDVVIVPPSHGQVYNGYGVLGGQNAVTEANPYANSYMRAIEESIHTWQDAINSSGASWLVSGLKLNVYVLGRDVFTGDAEIVVTTDENKGPILGMAVSSNPCLVVNSKFFITSYTYTDMFNINTHEFGHCLGLDHVAGDHPTEDVLNAVYQHNPGSRNNPTLCPSNLNVKTVEGAFARVLGQSSSLWGKAGSVSTGAYQKLC